jgi:hypothetical protein
LKNIEDKWWRLNNLYYIKDKGGNKVKLQVNWAQRLLLKNMWYLNIILKARQLGMTTLIQIYFLDQCLFGENVSAGVIAHNREDAEAFFDDKIKFAYDHLPDWLKEKVPARSDSARELSFANGSKIRVGTSMRSGTLQYLHVSEFGKICAKYPDKAKEIISGSLNTVAKGQFIFIESTAEGDGKFKDMFYEAWHNPDNLSELDYRAHFYPWWQHPEYVLEGVTPFIDDAMREYFGELEATEGIRLTTEQKAWYITKSKDQGDMMKQEYPATPEEAFSKLLEGVILAEQLKSMRKEGRICRLPVNRHAPVNTFWDLGLDDFTSIWFHQREGEWDCFIKYYEYRDVDIAWYAERLADFARENGWVYGRHYVPHDATKRQETGLGYLERKVDILQRLVPDKVELVPRIPVLNDGIEMLRGRMSRYKIDEEGCADGILRLENYMWKSDPNPDPKGRTVFRKTPKDNDCQHAADAIRTHAQGYRGPKGSFADQLEERTSSSRAYTRKKSFNPITNPSYEHVV